MVEVITNPQLKSFVHSSVSNDFGLTVEQIAEKCKSDGRFSAWLNGDVTRIKEVLNAVKENGVSPAFFAGYEKTEGYNSKWGWLNHTSINGDPVSDAISVSQWIVSQSRNTTSNPAWIDYANYNDFVPNDVKSAGNADFANMTLGSIGKVVIAGTAAATWEVYYPNGLKVEYNGVQNYGTPINHMMNYIIAWGGSISGGSTGGLQLAQFPMDMIHITQGENGSYSHMGTLAIDFVGTHTKYPYYAPCDCECIRASNDLAVWKSDAEVMCADGVKRKIFWDCIHEVPLSHGVGTKLKKGQLMGHTGVGGTATGDHLHLQVMDGWDYQGFTTNAQGASTMVGTELHIFDVFAVNGVNIVEGYGYDWKTSDYVDGSGGGSDVGNSNNILVTLWLVDALNGWK